MNISFTRVSRRTVVCFLLALSFTAFALSAICEPSIAQSLGDATANAIFDMQGNGSKDSATTHSAPRVRSQRPRSHTQATQSGSVKKAGRAGKTSQKPGTKPPAIPNAWSTKGAINLDSIKDMEGLTGLLLIGGPSIDLGMASNSLNALSQAGLGSAAIWGVVGAVLAVILKAILDSMTPKNTGARPDLAPKSNNTAAIAIMIFFVAFIGKLFGFPEKTIDITDKEPLHLTPVYSNEFGLKCFLPKNIIKAKFSERVLTGDISVTVAGYRNGKNEMMIGYAHLPSIDEMIKAKEKQGPSLSQYAQMGAFGAGKIQYYFDVNKALDGVVEAVGKRADFKVSYRCPIEVQKMPGREYEGKASHDRLVRGRVFMGYNNYYHVIVVGEPSFVNSPDGFKCLNSLTVN